MAEPELRIELGAGARKMPGWTGIDISPKADLVCDIGTEVWPFADGSVREIYASHVLEHFSYLTTMRHVLDECLRVLCPGGRLRVAVPDASIYIRAYLEGRDFPEVIPVYKRAYFFNSPIDSINYIAYMAEQHRHMFDMENLLCVLRNAGFVRVAARDFDPEIDVAKRHPQSIYAEAFKA